MQQISFTSTLRPTTLKEFSRITGSFGKKNFVDYPWTINESVKDKSVYTTGIRDCTACLITDGQEGLLMHICPTIEMNHNFVKILTFIRRNIDLKNNNLQAVLVGSRNDKKSLNIYNEFKKLLGQFDIPTSELKNGKKSTHIAYRTDTDEVLITNETIDNCLRKGQPTPKSVLESGFEKIFVAECDDIA